MPKTVRLANIGQVRRELGRLYKRARDGQMDTLDAARLAGILAIIGRMIESSDVERRLEQLEEQTGVDHWRQAA